MPNQDDMSKRGQSEIPESVTRQSDKDELRQALGGRGAGLLGRLELCFIVPKKMTRTNEH